jgi:hypothetical protein
VTPGTYNHRTYTGSNSIWNPYGSLNVGAEFLYRWVMEQNGLKAVQCEVRLREGGRRQVERSPGF